MSSITLMRDETGKIDGFTEDDRRKWGMFRSELANLSPGELCQLSHWFARNRPFHNLHMRIVRDIFEAQELFTDFNIMRKWLYIGAGHVDWVPGRNSLVPVPKSVAYDEIDEADMRAVHEKVVDYLRSEEARRRLWPHLQDDQTYETIETLLAQYERQPA